MYMYWVSWVMEKLLVYEVTRGLQHIRQETIDQENNTYKGV